MLRFIIFIIWVLVGFGFLLSGCRAAITAEKLEASVTIHNPMAPAPPPEKPKPNEK